jgi:hypothetical protein
MEKIWVFVSRDKEDKENVCGSLSGALGKQPLMTGNAKTLELMKPLARALAAAAPPDKTIHLLTFSNREEVTEW